MLHEWKVSGRELSFRGIFSESWSSGNIAIQWVAFRWLSHLYYKGVILERNGYYTRKEYCPIDGKYSITYKNNNPEQSNECTGNDSSMDSCPSGSILNFRLRGCTATPNTFDLRFECMASWKGPNNENYLIFSDNNRQLNGQKPKYRCAVSTDIVYPFVRYGTVFNQNSWYNFVCCEVYNHNGQDGFGSASLSKPLTKNFSCTTTSTAPTRAKWR